MSHEGNSNAGGVVQPPGGKSEAVSRAAAARLVGGVPAAPLADDEGDEFAVQPSNELELVAGFGRDDARPIPGVRRRRGGLRVGDLGGEGIVLPGDVTVGARLREEQGPGGFLEAERDHTVRAVALGDAPRLKYALRRALGVPPGGFKPLIARRGARISFGQRGGAVPDAAVLRGGRRVARERHRRGARGEENEDVESDDEGEPSAHRA